MTVSIYFIVSGEFSELSCGSISMLPTLTLFPGIILLSSLEKTYKREGGTLIQKEMPVLQIRWF